MDNLVETALARLMPRVRAIAPELDIQTTLYNGDGLANELVIVNNAVAFRFARHNWGRAALRNELIVLDRIRGHMPIRVPEPFHRSDDSMAYTLLAGRALSPQALNAMQVADRERVAAQIGTFLQALHHTALPDDLPRTSAPVTHAVWLERHERIRNTLYSLMLPHQVAWAEALFGQALANDSFFEYTPALIHGDLAPYHLLTDLESATLSGVIDFGVAGMGDPASDLGSMLQVYGSRFVEALLVAYPQARALLTRAKFYAQAIELEWVMNGLEQGQTFWFTAHLGAARDLEQWHA